MHSVSASGGGRRCKTNVSVKQLWQRRKPEKRIEQSVGYCKIQPDFNTCWLANVRAVDRQVVQGTAGGGRPRSARGPNESGVVR